MEWTTVPVEVRETIEFAEGPSGGESVCEMSLPALDAVLQVCGGHPQAKLCVVGHAGADEPDPQRVSLERARKVEQLMVERGVDPARLRAVLASLTVAPAAQLAHPASA